MCQDSRKIPPGFSSEPLLWPLLLLTVSGLLVALTLHYLPGTGGHKPAEGFKAGGATVPIELPGIILASFFTLSLGVVLGPEAPLIAIGKRHGARIIAYYFECSVRLAIVRNAQREGKGRVPKVAIFTTQKKMQPPAPAEGFDEVHVINAGS